ncbi:hypothetical protein MMC12_001306 [Toensbergia leucococca]|nr:hypothetical protein [Toensbergia leucococca]
MPSKSEDSFNLDSVVRAFEKIKEKTDDLLVRNGMDTYSEEFLVRTDELVIVVFCKAFEDLGCHVQSAAPGTKLTRVEHDPSRAKYVDFIYNILEHKAGLVEMRDGNIIRTSVPCACDEPSDLLEDLLDDRPDQNVELRLISITSVSFKEFLQGKTDAVKLLFGTDVGKTLLSDFYAKSRLFSTVLDQLSLFFKKIGAMWPHHGEALRILEVGAGTGGTTWKIVPVLARLGIPVVYTMTDLGSSFGALAQEKFEKYPFVKFEVLDIEKEPAEHLRHTQHIVLGSNVFHATPNVSTAMTNVRTMLRPDGFVVLHELTAQMLWADMIFGLFLGWWMFEDQRKYVLQEPHDWAKVLKSAGFGKVDWTDGKRPEAKVQALILGMASSTG